jgi:hypothetical protein
MQGNLFAYNTLKYVRKSKRRISINIYLTKLDYQIQLLSHGEETPDIAQRHAAGVVDTFRTPRAAPAIGLGFV